MWSIAQRLATLNRSASRDWPCPQKVSRKSAEPACKPGPVVNSHSSRPDVAVRLKRPTRERRGPRHSSPIWSCSGWGLPCRAALTPHAVRSYRTVSPLPDPLARPSAVCFLLHWPSVRTAQALPGTLPYGARTFLEILAYRATVRPTPRAQCNRSGDRPVRTNREMQASALNTAVTKRAIETCSSHACDCFRTKS